VAVTFQEQPLDLALPLAWPSAAEGCAVCQALARQREEAARRGDYSRVSDCNVEIRGHHVSGRRGA
jgi:hypothetical protein